MKKYFLLIIFSLFVSLNLYGSGLSVPGILSSVLNNDEKKNKETSTFDTKNIDELLLVLKDEKQLLLLIKSLELLKNIPQDNEKSKSQSALASPFDNLYSGNIIEEYTGINELTNISTNSFKGMLIEIKNILNNRILYWILWLCWLFFGMAIFFFVENLLRISLKIDKSKILNKLNLRKNAKKFQLKYGKYGIYYNILFFLLHLLTLSFPAILASFIAILVINSIITIDYYYQITEILILLLFVRIFLYLFNSIFRQFTKSTFRNLNYWIHMFIYIVFTFLVLNNLFLQEYIQNNGLILIKLNLLIFVALLILVFFKIKVLVLKIISRGFFDDNIDGKRNLPYRYFVLLVRKYYILLVSLLLISILFSVFLLQYSVAKQIILRVFLSMLMVIVIYTTHRLTISMFYSKVINKIQANLNDYYQSSQEFVLSYKYLNIDKLWKFFHYAYNFIMVYMLILIIDKIWSLGVNDIILKIFSVKIVEIVFGMYVGIGILLLITLTILLLIQKIVLNSFAINDIANVKKVLSIFMLCDKPYKILFGIITIIIFLSVIGIPITALIASTGAFTIVIAFLTKDVLKNFTNALMFFLEDAFSLNDLVEIDGLRGTLESMSLVYLRLRDNDGKLHLVPFSAIKTITNYSKDFAYALINVGISYDNDPELAIKVLNNIYNNLLLSEFGESIIGPLELQGVTELGAYSVNIRCKIKTRGGKQFGVRNEFFKQIHREFKLNGIEIPYPHSVFINKKQ
jgi:small conductance mechanosensitive channel